MSYFNAGQFFTVMAIIIRVKTFARCFEGLKTLFLFVVLMVLSGYAFSQADTIIYTGVNGRLVSPEKANVRKEIDYRSSSGIRILTSVLSENTWKKLYKEKIKIVDDESYQIRVKGTGHSGVFIRRYDGGKDGVFRFSEFSVNGLIKTGYTLSKIPLVLHGEVTDYYDNGRVRSKSVFRNNELVSNHNWLENGEKYIDTIFYSVDEVPMLSGGNLKLHQHLRQVFLNSGLDFSSVSGNMVLGFVVMETGTIAGIRVVKGLESRLNDIAVNALKNLGGKWKPARLDGKDVRYFQLLPVNFIHKEASFQSLYFDGYMIHYEKY